MKRSPPQVVSERGDLSRRHAGKQDQRIVIELLAGLYSQFAKSLNLLP